MIDQPDDLDDAPDEISDADRLDDERGPVARASWPTGASVELWPAAWRTGHKNPTQRQTVTVTESNGYRHSITDHPATAEQAYSLVRSRLEREAIDNAS